MELIWDLNCDSGHSPPLSQGVRLDFSIDITHVEFIYSSMDTPNNGTWNIRISSQSS